MKADQTRLMKTLSRELVLDMSPYLKVEKHQGWIAGWQDCRKLGLVDHP